jgi:hypothetical protein
LYAAGIVACLLGVYRQLGRPQFSQDYMGDFMANDFGTAILYMLSVLLVTSRGPFLYLPVIMQFVIGVAEFEARTEYSFLKFSKVKGFFEGVQQLKNEIKVGKAYAEFFNIFYFLLLAILGLQSVIVVVIYINFVKYKFKMNVVSHGIINSTKSWLKGKSAGLPGSKIFEKAIDGVFWLITF